MLTPYEFGRDTGKMQARINREEVSEERIKELAELLAFEENEITEFSEGYRNGFTEAKAAEEDDQGKLAAEAAFEEIEIDEADLKAAIAHGRQLVDENVGYKYY